MVALPDFPSYVKTTISSFYSWNTDLSYNWWFAPGSQVSILYQNNGYAFNIINKDFGQSPTY
jgi:hypothetical protein